MNLTVYMTSPHATSETETRLALESVDQQAVPEPAVADGEGVLAQLVHHRLDDACARQDDVSPLRLQSDDFAAILLRPRAIELDLPLYLGAIDHGPLHDVRIVVRKRVLHCSDVRDGASHPDQHIGRVPRAEPSEICRDRIKCGAELPRGNRFGKAVPLGIPDGADVQAEALFDDRAAAESELRAPPACVEYGQ